MPERWSGTWTDNLALVRMADEAGIDFMLPIGRWKGYGGDTGYQEATLETITWATGLLAATKHITVFGTVHAPLFHPVIAAKQMVTADHIGEGRFGLNIVVGWNEGEFEMFGVEQRDARDALRIRPGLDRRHQADVVGARRFRFRRRLHQAEEGARQAEALRRHAAGHHERRRLRVGRAFAVKNCDAFFMQASRTSVEETAQRVAAAKAAAAAHGRELGVFTVGVITCRPTMTEAKAYHDHCVIDQADWGAVDHMLALRNITAEHGVRGGIPAAAHQPTLTATAACRSSAIPITSRDKLIELSRAGLDGIAVSFVNYADELPFFRAEVLPRLERAGLRVPASCEPALLQLDAGVLDHLAPLRAVVLDHAANSCGVSATTSRPAVTSFCFTSSVCITFISSR